MPSKDETSEVVISLADSYRAMAERVRKLRKDLPHGGERKEALNTERRYLQKSEELYASAIEILGDNAVQAIAALKGAAASISDFADKIDDIKKCLKVTGTVLGVGVAVLSGSSGAILSSIWVLLKLLNEDDDDTKDIVAEIKSATKTLKARLQVRSAKLVD
ncbi:hypothetical protein SAMN03159444_01918 [Pseudomonas sp. NFACC02]|uniref:hypothetical protein n=1 Tax=Pseudomonas sp. NFACC02 TaxID=1566250 RepID=UPI0008B79AAC|nr:hypothetical protein [Pseudomonas sp. NFACC02]SEQ55063.1 hypothetical protein SAMN03159444_01918 [Pseudomonas sp. NFACC02]